MLQDFYPLKFETIFKEKIWGGQKIRDVLKKDSGTLDNCGETWELSGVKGNVSKIANGRYTGKLITELITKYKGHLLGEKIYQTFRGEFPLLIKFIDANDDLSIQVHPDDRLAHQRHQSKGKTEMWYILQADPGASLITGFNKPIHREEYLEYFNHGHLMHLLNVEKVNKGDVFFIPAGRIHTIGKGILLAEIQQSSDITYRIYDYGRVDAHGNKRDLHTKEALEAIDFTHYSDYTTHYNHALNTTNAITKTPFFTTNKLFVNKNILLNRSSLDCFKIYICVSGKGQINNESISMGEVVLIPAVTKKIAVHPDVSIELLETYIEM